MNNAPSIELLDSLVAAERERDTRLHVHIRKGMRRVIDDHFEDGQQFWTEQSLIDKLAVSQITVRRALNDLAKEGFLLRKAARGTIVRKASRTETTAFRVAVFVPKHQSDILTNTLDKLASICYERDQRIETHFTHKDQSVEDAIETLQHPVDAVRVILLGQPKSVAVEMLALLAMRGYRAVAVETTILTENTDYIGFDNEQAVDVAVKYLVSLGHRRITLLVNEPDLADEVVARRNAFDRMVESGTIDGTVISSSTEFWDSAYDAAYRMMPVVWAQTPRPTALLTVSDVGAWASLKWFAQQGIRVPEDVSVMGFDDDRLSKYTHPALTTLGRDRVELARQTIDCLSQSQPTQVKKLLNPYLVERDSTAKAINKLQN